MNKRQKLKHLQKLNAKHIEARLELSRALDSAIEEVKIADRLRDRQFEIITGLVESIEAQQDEIIRLKFELSKPLLSRLWRWNR